jgi:hypothetical protein
MTNNLEDFWDYLCSELEILGDEKKQDIVREYGRIMIEEYNEWLLNQRDVQDIWIGDNTIKQYYKDLKLEELNKKCSHDAIENPRVDYPRIVT